MQRKQPRIKKERKRLHNKRHSFCILFCVFYGFQAKEIFSLSVRIPPRSHSFRVIHSSSTPSRKLSIAPPFQDTNLGSISRRLLKTSTRSTSKIIRMTRFSSIRSLFFLVCIIVLGLCFQLTRQWWNMLK